MSTSDEVKKFLSEIGRKGGSATGQSKVRGDSEYYRGISAKAVQARKARKEGGKA